MNELQGYALVPLPQAQRMGDAGGGGDDCSYTGECDSSPLSVGYVRAKFLEFQGLLNGLDRAREAALLAVEPVNEVDPYLAAELLDLLDALSARAGELRATAEAINAVAAAVNAAGGRLPVVSIPQRLGLLQLVPLAAGAAAVAAVGAVAYWGGQIIGGINERLARGQLLSAQMTPEARARMADAMAKGDQARALAEGSALSQVGGIIKWVGIGVAAYFGFRAFQTWRGRRRG